MSASDRARKLVQETGCTYREAVAQVAASAMAARTRTVQAVITTADGGPHSPALVEAMITVARTDKAVRWDALGNGEQVMAVARNVEVSLDRRQITLDLLMTPAQGDKLTSQRPAVVRPAADQRYGERATPANRRGGKRGGRG